MNKLTASRCRVRINELRFTDNNHGLSNQAYDYLEALEIALPVLEQQESCQARTDLISTPQHILDEKWNAHFGVTPQSPTDTYRQIENDGWIEWGGGENPVPGKTIALTYRDGDVDDERFASSDCYTWTHDGEAGDIIAYRVIENDGREKTDKEKADDSLSRRTNNT